MFMSTACLVELYIMFRGMGYVNFRVVVTYVVIL